jgi:hypothetical protein
MVHVEKIVEEDDEATLERQLGTRRKVATERSQVSQNERSCI